MFLEIVNYVIFTLFLNYSNILPLILVHVIISVDLTKTREIGNAVENNAITREVQI
jgi:hypothetical protein